MALEEKREKRPPVTPMMIEEEAALRNGSRGLPPGPWAEAAGPRPRTTERHIAVHKRLVLGFAVSILALLAVTMIAVLLSVRFEECGAAADGPPRAGGNGSLSGAARQPPGAEQPPGQSEEEARGGEAAEEEEEEEEEEWQRRRELPPWARPRLPRHLRPLHYNLMLSAFMENFTFSGEVNVQLEVRNASRYIVLHAHRMHIEAVRVAEDKLAGGVRVARTFFYPQTQVFVVVLNRSLEVQRSYNLKIIYNALIENELLGFFRSSYVLHGERRFLGVTQFSPTHARKAFPCFDEPIYKATFKISIRHQATYLSLSNMPVETSVFEEDGWVTDHFSQTPLMSTYYLAWAVCNFTYRETVTKSGVVDCSSGDLKTWTVHMADATGEGCLGRSVPSPEAGPVMSPECLKAPVVNQNHSAEV
uniref:Thyrotropin releasing hormone degrading enzyme n=1 Tax=Corvus moneduloides TaxID=1196302 RepID=A0A8U7N494_CORMO